MEIIIDPRLQYNYASYYLYGILCLFDRKNIRYDITPFKSLTYKNRSDYNSGFAFIYKSNNIERKIFIDTEDVAKIFEDRYSWCDVYGMVNPTNEQIQQYAKLMPIGPEFGITLFSIFRNISKCISMFIKGHTYNKIPFKDYLRDYLYSNIRRRSIDKYETLVEIKPNYIFHASTLWYNKFADTNTNMYRGEFLKSCQRAKLEIEGGLFYIEGADVLAEMPEYPKYKEEYADFIYNKRLSIDEYIKTTKESILVFNTPSVCECHGWKLAEYLCMGKAIISTPLTREMPATLIHGENVHFVERVEDIYNAVLQIKNDDEYREKLECGARAYYEKWLAPDVVIKRIIEKAQQN